RKSPRQGTQRPRGGHQPDTVIRAWSPSAVFATCSRTTLVSSQNSSQERPAPRSRGTLSANAMSDIRYALRLLVRSRLFTITVVLVIGIGIGAATTIFSIVNAVLLRPLPFRDPSRLMQIAEKN